MVAYAYVTKSAAGPWFWYKLDPADLGVNTFDAFPGGLTILWRGGTDLGRLKTFFEKAATQVCKFRERYLRVSFMTQEGTQSVNFSVGQSLSIPEDSFVRFDCFPNQQISNEAITPVFTVFANRDREATSLDDLQESVAISLQTTDLIELEKDIAGIVAASSSRFFPDRKSYDSAIVMDTLEKIRLEVPMFFSH